LNALVIILKVLGLVLAACFLVGSGLCVVGSLINFPSTPGPALGILAISLLIATPSYLLTRAIWRSLTRKPAQNVAGIAIEPHTTDMELKSQTPEPDR
jgi:hypothetical protein